MHIILIWAIAFTLAGICLMLYGIGFISRYPRAALPRWVKVFLIAISLCFALVYILLVIRLVITIAGAESGQFIDKGGIWI
ncbi:MAG: hypothetical protein H0Z38_08365 [Firmicutes bacterium]|nr:hypothetical protein [Bacillota bacterium]